VATLLASGTPDAHAMGIAITGNDAYTSGTLLSNGGDTATAICWANRSPSVLNKGIKGARAIGIFLPREDISEDRRKAGN
jgi:hypothetical protein